MTFLLSTVCRRKASVNFTLVILSGASVNFTFVILSGSSVNFTFLSLLSVRSKSFQTLSGVRCQYLSYNSCLELVLIHVDMYTL